MKIIFFIVLLKLINADENNDNQFIETLPADVKKTLLDKISRRILEEVPEVDTEDTATNGEIIDAKLEEQSEFVKKILREEIDSLKARKKNDDDKLEVPAGDDNVTIARSNGNIEHIDLTLRARSKRAGDDENLNRTRETSKNKSDKEENVTTDVNIEIERKDNLNDNITKNNQGQDDKNDGSETTFQNEENSLTNVTLKNSNENQTVNIQRQDDRNDNASIIFPSKEISVKVLTLKQDKKINLSPSGVNLSNDKKKLLRNNGDGSASPNADQKNKTKDIPQTESTTVNKLPEKVVNLPKKTTEDVKDDSEKQKLGPTTGKNQKLEEPRSIPKKSSDRNGQLFSNETSNEYLENDSPTETILTKDTKVDIVEKIEGSTKREVFNTVKLGLRNDNVFATVPTRTTSAPYHATAFTKSTNSEITTVEKESSKTLNIRSYENYKINMKNTTDVKKPCNKTKTLDGTKSDCDTKKSNVTTEDSKPIKGTYSPMRSLPTDVKKPCNKTKTLNGTKSDCDTKSNVAIEENTIPVKVNLSPMRTLVESKTRQASAEHFGALRNTKEYQVFEIDENKSSFVQVKETEGVEQPHYFPVYNYEPRNVYYNADNRYGPNIESERTDLRDNAKVQRKLASTEHFGDLEEERGYQAFEADSNTQLEQENRYDNAEEPQYYPVYNYDPKNVYYNAFNRLGPNDDDAEIEIESSTLMDGKRMPRQPKQVLINNNKQKRQIQNYVPRKRSSNIHPPGDVIYHQALNRGIKSNLQAIRYILNRDQNFGYIAVNHEQDMKKRSGLRGNADNIIWENTYEIDSEYDNDLNDDSTDNEEVNSTDEINSLIDFLIKLRDKKRYTKKTPETEWFPGKNKVSLNGENYDLKNLNYPLQKSQKVLENQMKVSRWLASIKDMQRDKFKPSDDGSESKWENSPRKFEHENKQNLDDNYLPFRQHCTEDDPYKVDTIEKIISITPEADVFTQLGRLMKKKVPISRSNDNDEDDDLDTHLNILKDLVQLDSAGLEMYDWLGTTVDIQAALTKLIDLVNRRNTFSFIHPADLQLLKYVEAIHKNAQKVLLQKEKDEIPLPKAVYHSMQSYKRLPKFKKKIQNPITIINKLYKVRSSDNLEGFLFDLKNGLEDFHILIKEISKVTKFNNQRWYKNIKELYLANDGRKEYLEVLLHLFSTRLFGLIEESLMHGAEDNYLTYMRKNRAEVDRTEVEMIFILRILRAIKNLNV